jgi:inorganic pyrophosphatase
MHPWHDIVVDPSSLPRSVPAVVEVPKGSKSKYEIDKPSGLLRLDRVLYSAVHYPANYGFIPRTYCDDGDALDILVLTQATLQPLCIVDARPVGVMRMRDDKGGDDKIIAVAVHDPAMAGYHELDDLPPHTMREIRRFFEDYKALENKQVVIEDLHGAAAANDIVRTALEPYQTVQPR